MTSCGESNSLPGLYWRVDLDYDCAMQHKISGKPIVWLESSLRWLVLLGLVLALASGGGLSQEIVLILGSATLWNIVNTLLVAVDRSWRGLHYLSVVFDLAFASILFYLSGAFRGVIGWAGLLAILPASLHFRFRGLLLIAFFSLLAQGLIAFTRQDAVGSGVYLAALALVYGGAGAVFSYFAQRLGKIWSRLEREQIEALAASEQAKREHSRRIYQLISVLSATLNFNRVLDISLDLAHRALASEAGPDPELVSAVLLYTEGDYQGKALRVRSSRRFTQADRNMSIPGVNGLVGVAIDDGISKLGRELKSDPELGRVIALKSCASGYCIPLRAGLDTYGVLLFAHPKEEYFTEERRELLDIIGSQAVIALKNASLYRDIELEKERVVEVQEEARKKLARDLHDGPTQSIAALAMRINFARRLIDRDPKAAADEMQKIEELARRATKEIRHMLFTLRPLILESQGLIAGLQSMAEKMKETYSQNVIVEADPEVVADLEMGKQGVIFYIVEEAVNNARKHAQAEHIWVSLKSKNEEFILLEIEDDGVGFDLKQVDANYEQRGSLGMINLRERTELVNGLLQIDSVIGRGTRVKVAIPLTEEAADRLRQGHPS